MSFLNYSSIFQDFSYLIGVEDAISEIVVSVPPLKQKQEFFILNNS